MSRFQVNVHVYDGFADGVSASRLRQIAARALSVGRAGDESSLSVVVAGDEAVRGLNRQHRGLDETTDVLSFSFAHAGEYLGDPEPTAVVDDDIGFVLPPGQDATLGEVVISYPQAERQAAQSGHPVEKELAVLLTHGIMHLLGHDHEVPEEAAAMKRVERRVFERVWEEKR